MQQNPNERMPAWFLAHGAPLHLLVTLGSGSGESVIPLYRDWEYGNLAMHSYRIGAAL